MNKGLLKKTVIGIIIFVIVIFGINIAVAMNKVGSYKVNKHYEELTFTEKIAAKLKGWIFSDEKEEAQEIIDIFSPIASYIGTKDNEDTDIKIKKCKAVLMLLDKENESGRITTNNLINLINDCKNTTDYYLKALEAFKGSDPSKYSTYSGKMVESFKNVNNDLSRLGFTN
ncbi:hypothetical protein [Clostridium sp.]|uniref:hypothetical protein n=1 Tax=Clostridium sp. TaxID=1506 RepID=UPI003463AA2B